MDGDVTNDWTSKSGMQEQLWEFGTSYALCQTSTTETAPNQSLKPCSIFTQVIIVLFAITWIFNGIFQF